MLLSKITASPCRRCRFLCGYCCACCRLRRKPSQRCFASQEPGFDHGHVRFPIPWSGLGAKNGFDVDTTDDTAGYFKEAKLKEYKAVCLSTSPGTSSTIPQRRRSSGIYGRRGSWECTHARLRIYLHWYHQMLGAYFAGHPLASHPPNSLFSITTIRQHSSLGRTPFPAATNGISSTPRRTTRS